MSRFAKYFEQWQVLNFGISICLLRVAIFTRWIPILECLLCTKQFPCMILLPSNNCSLRGAGVPSPQGLISKVTYAKSKSVLEEPGFEARPGQTLQPEYIVLILFLAEVKEI